MGPKIDDNFDHVDIPIIMQDSDFRLVSCNRSFRETFGVGFKDIVEVMTPGARVSARILRTILFETEAYSVTCRWPYLFEGELKYFRVFTSKNIIDGSVFYVGTIFVDDFYKNFINAEDRNDSGRLMSNSISDLMKRYQDVIKDQAIEISQLRDVIKMSLVDYKGKI